MSDLGEGTQYGRYRILRLIGRGGFGSVYLADDTNPFIPRQVALKILDGALSRDATFRERFLRESRVAIELGHHPNIVTIYDAGENDDGTLFIAMRFIEGTDLDSFIAARGHLDPDTTTSILTQVASVLDTAHAAGVVHRDVKPGNILLSPDGRTAYLADFGINKRMFSDGTLSVTGEFIGTLRYAAPEQLEGKAVDGRTDEYALACVLYECLTGQPPFSGDTATLIKAHLHEAPVPISDRTSHVATAIDDVVSRGLQKRPADRYATCSELAAATERALSDAGATVRVTPPVAPPAAATEGDHGQTWTAGAIPGTPPPPPPSTPWVASPPSAPAGAPRRRGVWVGVGVVFVLVLLAGVVLIARGGSQGFPNKSEKVLLNVVPAAFRGTCKRATSDLATSGTEAEVRCHATGGADAVVYLRFRSRPELDKAYDRALKARGISRDTPEDCSQRSEAEGVYAGEDNYAGRLFCYRDSGHSFITWTSNEQRLLSRADRPDRNDTDLYTWWAQQVGREESPAHPATGTSMTADQQALLNHVPTDIRATCRAGEDVNAPGFVAGVTCGPSGGTDVIDYLQFRDVGTMNQSYDSVRNANGIASSTGTQPTCPHEEGYSVSGVHKGRDVCFVTADKQARLDWTYDELSILTEAQRNDGNATALIDWWNGDTGPI